MPRRLIHPVLVLLLITFGLMFVAPPWYHLAAVLVFVGVFVAALVIIVRVLMVGSRSQAKDDPGSSGDRTVRLWVLFAGAVLCLVLFALATLSANRTLTAAAIGPHPLRVVPAQVLTSFRGLPDRGSPSTEVWYRVSGHSYSFELPAQDSGDTKAQAVLAVSRSDPGHAAVYSDWRAGRAPGAVTASIGFTLAFILAAVVTRELGLPRRRRPPQQVRSPRDGRATSSPPGAPRPGRRH